MDAKEPRYVRPGSEFEDEQVFDRIPKWRKPEGEFQRGLFRVVARNFWPSGSEGKSIRHWYIELERSLVSLKTGIVAEYPEEWVKNCFDWAEAKNRKEGYPVIGLPALRNLIMNSERKNDFVRRWKKEENGRADSWG